MWSPVGLLLGLCQLAALQLPAEGAQSGRHYYGAPIGRLVGRTNNVSGEVYAVDEQSLFIKALTYDGLAPDAYFWSSTSASQPSSEGFIVPDEKGSTKPLEAYAARDVVLRLPEGKTLREIRWLSIWSRPARLSAGEIHLQQPVAVPRPLEIAPLSRLAHGLSSGPVTIVDAQTLLVADFHYDGLGPAAYFWLTRGGQGLGANGLRLKDENGSSAPLRRYSGETLVISLPDELTVHDFDFFGVWCKEFQVNFGQTRIPAPAKVPPSPKMLGVRPENKLNCEILYDELGFEIRWVLDGDDIVMQLVGKIEPGEYMAFGLGKDDSKSEMANADAAVAWVERDSGQVHAVDYFLGAKAQCANEPRGSCPDVKLAGGGDSLTLLHGAIVNGYSMVTFKRPQLGVDELYDQHVYSDGQQSVLWAIGALNDRKEIGYHRLRTRSSMFIDFARNPQWNCPIPDLNASMHGNLPVASASQLDSTFASSSSSGEPEPGRAGGEPIVRHLADHHDHGQHQHQPPPANSSAQQAAAANRDGPPDAWFVPSIVCPGERTFYAQIGPAGGRRGYEALTGRPAWAAAWYVNGLLVPELVLERGQTYRFVVEGGSDKTSANRRHPFYLTDSPEGGFHYKTDEERQRERIFAGVALRGDGQFVPTAEGRLCEWRATNATLADPDRYPTFSAYQRTLKLDCLAGQASMLKFAPDANTPDQIYYQCYTHRHMGWRIKVVDSCASYLSSLGSSRQMGQANNNIKRDTSSTIRSIGEQETSASESPPTINRRQSDGHLFPPDTRALERPHLAEFSAHDEDPLTLTTEMSSFPSDMLIVNASQLTQRQPVNLSLLEQLMKLSPNDLEIIEDNPSMASNYLPVPNAFNNQVRILTQPLNSTQQHKLSPKPQGGKTPKTLHSYMRRLASMYYPVQQQLASMLTGQTGAGPATSGQLSASTSSGQNSHQVAGHQQDPIPASASSGDQTAASFSLSNLVPKPKIDLSKANLSKKFNKLRIKSGRKYEPNSAQSRNRQPPTPAIEFNYDIFNNQLAQLEKQQKQFQSLEMAAWPPAQHQSPQASSEHMNYLQMLASPSDDSQSLQESGAFQSPGELSLLSQLQPPTYQRPMSSSYRLSPPRVSTVSLGPPTQFGQQPFVSDYLSFLMNKSAEPPSRPTDQWTSQSSAPQMHRHQANQNQAVFITRLPTPTNIHSPGYQQSSQPWPTTYSDELSVKYPNAPPHGQQRGQLVTYSDSANPNYQMSTMPSVSYSSLESHPMDGESLSGSGSGSHYDFRQQPSDPMDQQQTQQSNGSPASANLDSDHMLAIERFSKQSSERRAPSVVHPITGEQVRMDEHSGQTRVAASNQGDHHEILETADQTSIQMTSELRRLNSSDDPNQQAKTRQAIVLVSEAPPGSSDKNQRIGSTAAMNTRGNDQNQKLCERGEPGCLHQLTTESTSPTLRGSNYEVHSSSAIVSTVGPLIPSYGPTTTTQPSVVTSRGNDQSDLVLKSTLVEPITSTLVHTPSTPPMSSNQLSQQPFISRLNFDTNPFTPLELTNPMFYQDNQIMASNPYSMHLKPSPLIESMLNQYQNPFRPQPPVQVASYLAHHLASHNPSLVASDKSVASSDAVKMSASIPAVAPNQSYQSNSTITRPANELIILKPAILTEQTPQTYSLKPEFLQNQFKLIKENPPYNNEHDLYLNQNDLEPARRLAGHQFERLSSLSSPPSTSIALDPMQVAHTVTSFVKQTAASAQSKVTPSRDPAATNSGNDKKGNGTAANPGPKESETLTAIIVEGRTDSHPELGVLSPQHRQTSVPSKPIPFNFEITPLAAATDGNRLNPGGESSNTLLRDNNTDNAILSHVMSLISSNAIPAPPTVPVASYSSADYFLPITDRRVQRSVRG